MGKLTFRQKKRLMGKLQRLKLRRARNSACTSWWAAYRNSFIWGCILRNLWLVELTREENERAFSFRGLQCVFWQLLLSLFLLRRLPTPRTAVNQCQLSVVIPTQTLVQPETSSSGQPQDRLVSLLSVQGPGELQDFTCPNPDCKGEGSSWDVGQRAWATARISVEESFIYHSYDYTVAVLRFWCLLKN